MDMEIRGGRQPVSLRSAENGVLGGFALRYNKLSKNLGGFVEQIVPGALAKTLGDKLDVVCRYNHNDDYLLGRTSSGTLVLRDGEEGLDYEVTLPDTSAGRDIRALAARGDIAASSFAFLTRKDSWTKGENGTPTRSLESIQLIDVSPVVTPAYPDATSALRSLATHAGAEYEEVRNLAIAGDLGKLIADNRNATYVDLGGATAVAISGEIRGGDNEYRLSISVPTSIDIADVRAAIGDALGRRLSDTDDRKFPPKNETEKGEDEKTDASEEEPDEGEETPKSEENTDGDKSEDGDDADEKDNEEDEDSEKPRKRSLAELQRELDLRARVRH